MTGLAILLNGGARWRKLTRGCATCRNLAVSVYLAAALAVNHFPRTITAVPCRVDLATTFTPGHNPLTLELLRVAPAAVRWTRT